MEIAAYLDTSPAFDEDTAGFAVAYLDQTERDYRAFLAANQSGRISARATT